MNEEKPKGGNMKTSLFGMLVCDRTSACVGAPCEEAEEVPYVRVDRRYVSDPSKLMMGEEAWYANGANHRVEDGCVCRYFFSSRWMVRIEDGKALQAFIDKYGDVVIEKDNCGITPCYKIEIYDRE